SLSNTRRRATRSCPDELRDTAPRKTLAVKFWLARCPSSPTAWRCLCLRRVRETLASGCTMPVGGNHVYRDCQSDSSEHHYGIVSATALVRHQHVGAATRHVHDGCAFSREVSGRAGGGDQRSGAHWARHTHARRLSPR